MGRKSKQAGGHMPLTHYERTRKFASAAYGTVAQRLAGHSQYQIGDCGLTTQRLSSSSAAASAAATESGETVALCTPSGYLYAESAILEYLLTKTQELKAEQAASLQRRQQSDADEAARRKGEKNKRIATFQDAQRVVTKKSRTAGEDAQRDAALADLNRVSYWLSSAQPVLNAAAIAIDGDAPSTAAATTTTTLTTTLSTTKTTTTTAEDASSATPSPTLPPPPRPGSPLTGAALRRKDLWPVLVQWQPDDGTRVRCAVSARTVAPGAAVVAYWTSASTGGGGTAAAGGGGDNDPPSHRHGHHHREPGRLVLRTVYDELNLAVGARCPLTDRTIRRARVLQRSGSSFAASGQRVTAAQYRPTIT